MNLVEAEVGNEYLIRDIHCGDMELKKFLFTLGCYEGEPVTVIARKKKNTVLSIKDGRYSIDNDLARVIIV